MRDHPADSLHPNEPPLETHATVPLPDGQRRRLSARVRGYETDSGQRRFMAVVEDRSAEEERDLVRQEIGALMDTAGVGVATFDKNRGWLRGDQGRRNSAARAAGPCSPSVARSWKMNRCLNTNACSRRCGWASGWKCATPCATPNWGVRWLFTRVEPAPAGAVRRTATVVTLDVTDQEEAQRRNQELLRELTTILDSSSAGIAYLRGLVLVRCNRRFERMLGLDRGAADGCTLEHLLRSLPQAQQMLGEVRAAMLAGEPFETEICLGASGGSHIPLWTSISVRPTESSAGGADAVAVLTDIPAEGPAGRAGSPGA